jgi:hypothetical protein
MRFRAVTTSTVTTNSILVYRPNEFSFDVIPAPHSGFTSVLLDDLNLEVDEAGKVVSVWGLCPHTRWKEANLAPPEAAYGELFIMADKPLKRAVSLRLTTGKTYHPTFVDRSRGWVKIQGAPNPESAVMIIPGVIFEISQQGEFCTLWLHPQSGMTGAEARHPKAR